MRLLIKLRSLENSKYEMQYHYYLQGFIYNLLKSSKYSYLHDKEGYKFFCFSNIFPAYDLRQGDTRTLIISSPNGDFIDHLSKRLGEQLDRLEIKVGNMKFTINSIDKMSQKIPNNMPVVLITGTPIIVRIPTVKYHEYGIEPKNEYEYTYWRNEHPIDLFMSQIQNNLLKKYTEYHELKTTKKDNDVNPQTRSSSMFFQKFKFKKQVSTRLLMKGFNQIVIGTTWEFGFSIESNKNILQFALDSGLGERNSLGFGFMNMHQ